MLLDYLVTSRARRELLRLLWAEALEGSVSDLARRAGLSYAVAHRELGAMSAATVALRERRGNTLVYRANPGYVEAESLRALLDQAGNAAAALAGAADDAVRSWLRAAGAPVGAAPVRGRPPALEEVLAAALGVAHRDATVARVLPLLLWRQRERLDLSGLIQAATRRDERRTLGCFLELAGRLGRDERLLEASKTLRDGRVSRARPFFERRQGPLAMAAARKNTPALARRWGYLMNMGLDSFASTFARHARSE